MAIYLKLNTKATLNYGPFQWTETGGIVAFNNPSIANKGLLSLLIIHNILTKVSEAEYNNYIGKGGK